jgi:hypothetical protein
LPIKQAKGRHDLILSPLCLFIRRPDPVVIHQHAIEPGQPITANTGSLASASTLNSLKQ